MIDANINNVLAIVVCCKREEQCFFKYKHGQMGCTVPYKDKKRMKKKNA